MVSSARNAGLKNRFISRDLGLLPLFQMEICLFGGRTQIQSEFPAIKFSDYDEGKL